jgi:hypothetical protein
MEATISRHARPRIRRSPPSHPVWPATSEMALAHVIENQVEAAYRRDDLFTKRHAMMHAWADWCLVSHFAKVASIRKTA